MFNRSLWRKQLGKRLDIFARNPKQDIALNGSSSLIAHLAACTMRPFLDAYVREPVLAVQALATITNGPGANELVRRAARMRYQATRLINQEMRNNPAVRVDIERVMVAMDTISLVQQRLHGSQNHWFSRTLASELSGYAPEEFTHLRRRIHDNSKSFYDVFRVLRQRRGSYTHEDLILLYFGLNDSAPGVRAEAARRLGEYAWTPPEKLVNKLMHVALYDHDLVTRVAAARALGSLRDRIVSPDFLHTLSQHLDNSDRFVRSSTAMLLGELGELAGTEELVDQLTELLYDMDNYVREAAACTLGRMGMAALKPNVMDGLVNALEHEDVHGAAVASLTELRELKASLAVQQPPLTAAQASARAAAAPEQTADQLVDVQPGDARQGDEEQEDDFLSAIELGGQSAN